MRVKYRVLSSPEGHIRVTRIIHQNVEFLLSLHLQKDKREKDEDRKQSKPTISLKDFIVLLVNNESRRVEINNIIRIARLEFDEL